MSSGSTGAPWATVEDVRRICAEMIAGTAVNGAVPFDYVYGVRLVPPQAPAAPAPDSSPAGAASGETGGAICTCCAGRMACYHCPRHRAAAVGKACQDPGPAKDAATQAPASHDAKPDVMAPAPQLGTATGAVSAAEEARRIVRALDCGAISQSGAMHYILALVRMEVEASVKRLADEIVEVFSPLATRAERDILEYVKAARDRELVR